MLQGIRQLGKKVCPGTALALVTIALGGCQGVVGSTVVSQIRFIDASPDTAGLDMYLAGTPVAYNLGFGTITSYIPIAAGTYKVSADSAGSTQVLTTATAGLGVSKQYTVLIGNAQASLQSTVLTDQSQPAPSGQVSLRFIDQATRIGAVDIYIVPQGKALTDVSAVATNLTFSTNTGYLNVPVNTYAIEIVPTGTVPVGATTTTTATTTLYTGAQTMYPAGCARTIVLIDQQVLSTPALQVITANDFDSATATS